MRINHINNNSYKQTTGQNLSFKGWRPASLKNKEQIEKICNLLNTAKIRKVSISGHSFPDSDSIGSSFAMAVLLNTKYKTPVDIFISGKLPKKYRFLKGQPGVRVFPLFDDEPNLKRRFGRYDLSISMDTPDSTRMHKDYYRDIFLNSKYKIKIDHHEEPADSGLRIGNYADISLVDTNSVSAAQLVMQFVEPLGINKRHLPRRFNEAVYTGILGDTGYFKRPNVGFARKDTALLIKNGLKTEIVKDLLHPAIPKEIGDFITETTSNVKLSEKKRVVYLHLDDEFQKKLHELNNKDMEYEINNKLKSHIMILGKQLKTEFALIFSKIGENLLKVSARSAEVNILDTAKKYQGGGHENAAGFFIPIKKDVNTHIKEILKEFDELY